MNSNLAYQEDVWEELINGRVVAMSPRPRVNHNWVAENISFLFRSYLKGKKCVPLGDGYDLYLTDKDHFVPDFMVVCDRDKIQGNGVYGAPDLVAEVLSPRTESYDKKYKKAVYEKCGVKEYWLVSPEARSVEQHLLEDGRLTLNEVYAMEPDYMLAKMTEEERSALVTHFKCTLFDDLDIQLEDIFYGMLPE